MCGSQEHTEIMQHGSILSDLSTYAIEGTDRVYYIPEFVSEEEETYLLRQVRARTFAASYTANSRYTYSHLPSEINIRLSRAVDSGLFVR